MSNNAEPCAEQLASKQISSVVNFWFQPGRKRLHSKLWFHANASQDAEMRDQFLAVHTHLATNPAALSSWQTLKNGPIASIILLDQLPRNMFRGTPNMFSTDVLAIPIAKSVISSGQDKDMTAHERLFVYTCLGHSEVLDDVKRAEELLQGLAGEKDGEYDKMYLKSAREHVEMIEKFGRYCHRNALLNRPSTPSELLYLSTHSTKTWIRSVLPSTSPPTTQKTPNRPLRILVLHGFRQNARIISRALKKLTTSLRPHPIHFHFAESAQSYQVGFNPDAVDHGGDSFAMHRGWNVAGPHQKVWWNASDDGKLYRGWEGSVRALEALWKKEGGFDGIIGFSQGATLIGILASLPKPTPISFRFAINISGYPSRATAHLPRLRCIPPTVRSLNIYGARDEHLGTPAEMKARTLALAALFKDAEVVEHGGGHFTPGSWPVQRMAEFILERADVAGEAEEVHMGEVTGFEEKMDLSLEKTCQNPRRKFIPLGMGSYVRDKLVSSSQLKSVLSMEVPSTIDLASFLTFLGAIEQQHTEEERMMDDLLLLAYTLAATTFTVPSSKRLRDNKSFLNAWLALYTLNSGYMLRKLETIPTYGAWTDLTSLAVLNSTSSPSDAVQSEKDELHRAIVNLFAVQLEADYHTLLASLAASDEDGNASADLMDLSEAARGAPTKGMHVDKVCHLAGDIACVLRPIRTSPVSTSGEEEGEKGENDKENEKYEKDRMTTYVGYRKTCQRLRCALAKRDKEGLAHRFTKDGDGDKSLGRLSEEERRTILEAEPNSFMKYPEEVPVVPCTPGELAPLLQGLRSPLPHTSHPHVKFIKGTILRDQKVLDLCKQVVGPQGIGPLLGAMRECEAISGLLLGNNITGSEGAREISKYIVDPKSQITTWYIAGNQFSPDDIKLISSALATDTRVLSLWLKRNPVLPAGTAHLASMLRVNRTLTTLDLANCGLLDEGAVLLFGGLSENKGLRNLFLNVNGLTVKSAKVIGDHLEEGSVLEALGLNCNPLGDAGIIEIARGLAHDTRLIRLSLASCSISPAGVLSLVDALTPSHIRQTPHPRLSLLNLGFMKGTYVFNGLGNYMGDAGLKFISERLLTHVPSLVSLDISHNQISKVGLGHLADALSTLTNITTHHGGLCSLSFTQIGQTRSYALEARLKAFLRDNIRKWGKEAEEGRGNEGHWFDKGTQLLGEVECPPYVAEILSIYRTKD